MSYEEFSRYKSKFSYIVRVSNQLLIEKGEGEGQSECKSAVTCVILGRGRKEHRSGNRSPNQLLIDRGEIVDTVQTATGCPRLGRARGKHRFFFRFSNLLLRSQRRR